MFGIITEQRRHTGLFYMCAQDGLTPAFVCGVLQLLEEEVYSLMLFPYLKQWQFFFLFVSGILLLNYTGRLINQITNHT